MVTDRKERLDLSVLNENVRRDPEKAVAYWEKHYRDQVEAVAEDFVSHMGESRVLLLAGPSSSGKTTTSLNLMEALHRRGIRTIPVSLDDFFLRSFWIGASGSYLRPGAAISPFSILKRGAAAKK